jgi:hypothetical protein
MYVWDEQQKIIRAARGNFEETKFKMDCGMVSAVAHLPILVLRSMHCEMCGN